jgi:hypothetical protein
LRVAVVVVSLLQTFIQQLVVARVVCCILLPYLCQVQRQSQLAGAALLGLAAAV